MGIKGRDMALPVEQQVKYWGIAAVVLGVVLWLFGSVLLPFILGSAIAYVLDPVADRLERLGLSRALATIVIAICAVLIFLVVALPILRLLIDQAISLATTLPQAVADFRDFLTKHFPKIMVEAGPFHDALTSMRDTLKSYAGSLMHTLLSSASSVFQVVLLLVIVPVVSVYMLLDWDKMIADLGTLVPRDHQEVVGRLAREIDTVLASFIRGMGTVCLILGTYYAIMLMAVGLQFGLIIGAIAGLITFIPYLGSLLGGTIAIGLAIFQWWGPMDLNGDVVRESTDWLRISLVAAIFFSGQMTEGNYLTPKLVGSSVGLHPVWLLLALSVFGSLFGFVGMLVAVPLAAAIGVLTRFAAAQYRQGRLYQGVIGQDEQTAREQDNA